MPHGASRGVCSATTTTCARPCGLSRRAQLRLRGGAARHLAGRRSRRAAGGLASAGRARIRHSRFGRVGGRCRARLRAGARAAGQAARARFVRAVDALKASPASELRAPAVVTTRAHHLHQRYDRQAEGRRDHARERRLRRSPSLVQAWAWRASDRLLLVLPLHHVHGIINGLGSALAGARHVRDPAALRRRARCGRGSSSGEITVFTAVPTIYSKLIAVWDAAPARCRRARSEGVPARSA